MDYKKIWKESDLVFVLKNFVAAAILIMLIGSGVLLAVKIYTNHGEVAIVPSLVGRYTEEAEVILNNHKIEFQVIDSMYDSSKAFGTILEQTPPAGEAIKQNSIIYLIVNSRSIRNVPIPEVRDLSLRQAEAMLKSIGMELGETIFVPSEYNDLVLGIRHNGSSLKAGSKLPEKSEVTLIVGRAANSTSTIIVPDLIGMTVEQARVMIINSQFIVGSINFDVMPEGNAESYVIYSQTPVAGSWENAGKAIDITLTLDESKMPTNNENDEEDFF